MNLTYLLLPRQISSREDPPVLKELAIPLKHQHLMTLQRSLDNTTRRLNVRAPIIVMPGIIKITLALGFRLEHRNYLSLGLQ